MEMERQETKGNLHWTEASKFANKNKSRKEAEGGSTQREEVHK